MIRRICIHCAGDWIVQQKITVLIRKNFPCRRLTDRLWYRFSCRIAGAIRHCWLINSPFWPVTVFRVWRMRILSTRQHSAVNICPENWRWIFSAVWRKQTVSWIHLNAGQIFRNPGHIFRNRFLRKQNRTRKSIWWICPPEAERLFAVWSLLWNGWSEKRKSVSSMWFPITAS